MLLASFLLVHGSWHGAWCWDRLIPLLREAGHEARAIDLPAHGEDRMPPLRATLRGYGDRVAAAASEFDEKPIAVGHSMGGSAITQAAASHGDALAGLFYVCAFVPLRGDSLASLGFRDPKSLVMKRVSLASFALGAVRVAPGGARDLFYGTCTEADAKRAEQRLRPDPVRPLLQRLKGAVPDRLLRGYIECTEDRAISPSRQRAMAERASIRNIVTMQTDHSPFLSAPAELASHLSTLAKTRKF
jgi:pimeloyl-ACP methyl ester carboxylesterase